MDLQLEWRWILRQQCPLCQRGLTGDCSLQYNITAIDNEAAYLLGGAPDRSGSARGESPAQGADSEVTPASVVQGKGASLLGHNWLLVFRLDWKMIHQLRGEGLQELLECQGEVFQAELGTLRGYEAKIHVDPGAMLDSARHALSLMHSGENWTRS